jgi:deoxyribonuclease-4
MPRFGSHLSSAGGLYKALEKAVEYGFESVQLFTKSPSQWSAKAVTDDDAERFRLTMKTTKIREIAVHDSYLINLATTKDDVWQRSIDAFQDEVMRADKIGAKYLVTHPGAHLGAGEEIGIARVVEALNEVMRRCSDQSVQILLETTAGQGTTLGHRFEHLAAMLDGVDVPARFGVCFDTCHVFAAGYPLSPEAAYKGTMAEFDKVIGLKKLKLFHLNDSVKELGCRVDRHAHIGKGSMGLEPFRLVVNDRRFRNHAMILETAKEVDPELGDMDAVNLATLQSLRAEAE